MRRFLAVTAVCALGCEGSRAASTQVAAPVEEIAVIDVTGDAAPAAPECPPGSTWLASSRECVRPSVLPAPTYARGGPRDPCSPSAGDPMGLDGCDPESMGDRIPADADVERGAAIVAAERSLAACARDAGRAGGQAWVTFDGSGAVTDVSIVGPLGATAEGACIERALRAVRIDPLRHPRRDRLVVPARFTL